MRYKTIALSLMAFIVAGCTSPIVREPSIDVVSVTNKLTLKVKGQSLTENQLKDIESFIVQRGNPYGLNVKLVSDSVLGAKQFSDVSQMLLKKGLSKKQIHSENISESFDGDIQILVESFRAKIPECKSEKITPLLLNTYQSHSSYGCATASALAQMVADPKDLVVGEQLGPTNGARAVATIDAYTAPVTSSSESDQSSVSIISLPTGGSQ
ncbi:hypothetical protein F0266_11345 [Vibrio coralliilyticus]|uniref:CpaD family pilus assembly lipoprotein n=1 Tax=Vibrio coralliilyticus TaxID=190893 RepID=UPI00148C6571|nr:CpaD family pilus assembly lipoprotein [Vibrio coralliilyticus]NOH53529.1 hypothetical protein [Vibrio coralliilyticus]